MNITSAITKVYENEAAFGLRQNEPNFIRHSLVAFVAASAKKAGEGGRALILNKLARLFEGASIFEQLSYEVQKLRCIDTICNFVVYREGQAH